MSALTCQSKKIVVVELKTQVIYGKFLLCLKGCCFYQCNVFSLINLVEKQVGNHLEGVPFYGTRGDFSGAEISNRLVGNKRSNSESSFMGSSRDAFQMVPDSFQNSHLMKVTLNYQFILVLLQYSQKPKKKNSFACLFLSLMS